MKGRLRQSDQVHLAKGNPGKRRRAAPKEAPVQIAGITPPKWLKKSAVAVRTWNEIAPLLGSLNAVAQQDAIPLARYCRYIADWTIADEAVRKEGTFFDAIGTNGEATKKRHPAFQARQDLEKNLSSLEEQFGMNPRRRFELLRNQAAIGALGGLFGGASQPKAAKPESSEQPGSSLIGALSRLDSAPPTSH